MRGLRLWGGLVAAAGCAASLALALPVDAHEGGAPVIQVWKGRREMVLQEGERIVRTFDIAIGVNPVSTKERRGDNRTPEGRYFICEKRPQSRFHRFLGINYPNIDDAERGLAARLISNEEWTAIFFANLRQGIPPWHTAMGGRVGIHGHGGREAVPFNWTEGCIAVSDADIDFLYDRVPLGTRVIIHD